jgi:hypothetical protein
VTATNESPDPNCTKCRGTGIIPGSIAALDQRCDCAVEREIGRKWVVIPDSTKQLLRALSAELQEERTLRLRAEDAATKGDTARHVANGMKMEIDELRQQLQRREPSFSKEDVWKVARAALRNWYHYDDSCRVDYTQCIHCERTIDGYLPKQLKHSSDCPVLAAQDLLTGAPTE